MKQTDESQKILLKSQHIYWGLYYLILFSRILVPIWFILVFFLERRNYESTVFWGTFTLLIFILLTLAIAARPYRTTGTLVISDSRIFYEGELVELHNCDKVNLHLSNPINHSFFSTYFAFYQHGFGSYIQASSNNKNLLRVNFLLRTKNEANELKRILAISEQANKFNLQIDEFKQPTFPNWNSFKKLKKVYNNM